MEDLEQIDENAIWKELKTEKDPARRDALRDKLIRKYMYLVKVVAGRLSPKMHGNVDFDDMVGYGQFGLIDAINRFDYKKDVKFATYATSRIRGAVIDGLRSVDWIPRTVRDLAKNMEKIIGDLEARLGRSATDAEIADEIGITEGELRRRQAKVSCACCISLDDEWSGVDDANHSTLLDTIESPNSLNPDMQAEREEIKRIIMKAINELPEKERIVILGYYLEKATFKEIGRALNVSESRISQLHTKANERLRGKLTHFRKGII